MRYASLREGLQLAICPSVSGGGGIVPDLSGRGNHGVLTNMDASDYIAGANGRLLDLDGVDDFLALNPFMLNTLSQGTLTFFAASTRNLARNMVFGVGSSATIGNHAYFEMGGNFTGSYADESCGFGVLNSVGGTNYFIVTREGQGAYCDGQLRHFAVSSIDDKIFVNARDVGTTVATKLGDFFLNVPADSAGIGRRFYPASPENMLGQIDDVRIYNRLLTQQEIRLLASEPGIGLRPERTSVFFGAQLFNAAWARNSNMILSPVGAA